MFSIPTAADPAAQDRKRVLGAKWDPFAVITSNVPFLAVVQGRQRLSLGEIGWWRIALAVVIWAALVWAHPYITGGMAAVP